MIDFLCPRCERFYSVHNKLSGKVANCTCGQKFRVPGLLLVRNKKKYHCPFCRSTAKPVLERKVSTVGWILFAVFMVCCFPMFWIGLLLREDVKVCSDCGTKLGRR